MKKIIYMSFWTNDATFFYRLSVLAAINHPDLVIEQKPYSGDITWASFVGYDALILERPSSSNDVQIIKLAKQCGLKIFSDWDDNCLHLPTLHPMWHFYNDRKANVMECLALSDEVWVSTQSLKKVYSLLNKNIHVIPNSHNDYLFHGEQKKPFNTKTKKAFWRGGGSHEADVYAVAPELIKLINKKNKTWQFQFIGCRFIYLELNCGMNYTPVSQMPLLQYFQYMNTENPNIVFCPLQDNLFNQSKSNIAWIEATYAGAAFFGNTNLPEFSQECIFPLSELSEAMSKNYFSGALELANKESWELICDTLLLSNVNKIRQERLLKI